MNRFWLNIINSDIDFFSFISAAIMTLGFTMCFNENNVKNIISGIILIIVSIVFYILFVTLKQLSSQYRIKIDANKRLKDDEKNVWLNCYEKYALAMNLTLILSVVLLCISIFVMWYY